MSAGQTCEGLGNSLSDSPLLANTAMVPTICAVGETRDDTIIDTSPSTPAPATRSKLKTPNWDQLSLVAAGLSPDVAQIISASWRASTQPA